MCVDPLKPNEGLNGAPANPTSRSEMWGTERNENLFN